MKINTKTLLIASLIIVSVVLVLVKTSKEESVQTEESQLENLPESVEQKIDFVISTKIPTPPTQLPTFNIQDKLSEEAALKIAKSSGFEISPTITNHLQTTYYTWTKNDEKLSIQNSPPTISYSSKSPTSDEKMPLEGKLIQKSKSILFKYAIINSKINITPLEVKYFKSNGQNLISSPKNTANIAQISFVFLEKNNQVFLKNSSKPNVSVVVNSDLSIHSFSTDFIPTYEKSSYIRTLPINQAISTLMKNAAYLVELKYSSDSLTGESSPSNNFSKVEIERIDIIYALNHEKKKLMPNYRFSGKSFEEVRGNTHEIDVEYITPAFLEN